MNRLNLMLRIVSLTVAVFMAAALPAAAPPPAWETVDTTIVTEAVDDLAVTVRDHYIYVSVPRPTGVKLFTILGQPIAQATLPAGISRFRVGARGIYILKAGSITKRITI